MRFLSVVHPYAEGMTFSPKPTAVFGACEGAEPVLKRGLPVLSPLPYLSNDALPPHPSGESCV